MIRTSMIRKSLFALLVATSLATGALAASAIDGPVKVTSDTFTVDDANHKATFSGNVVLTRTGMQLWAPKVVIEYGEGGTTSVKSVVASGGVRIKTTSEDATGDTAVYDPKSQIMKLMGHVKVISDKGTLTGPELTIDMKTNVSTFTGGDNGRVTGTFNPE